MTQTLRKKDWRLTALLILVALVGLVPLGAGFFVEQPGRLVVLFRDNVFQSDIAPRQSTLTLDGKVIPASIRVSEKGAVFDLGRVAASSHTVGWTIEGFAKGEGAVTVLPTSVQPESTMIVDLRPEFGRVEVRGADATTNRVLAAPSLVILGADRKQMGSGVVLFSDVPPGVHKVHLQADGYCPDEQTVRVSAAETTQVTLTLSPSLDDDEAARIILEWNNAPEDLDGHLVVHLADEKTIRHICWYAMKSDKGGRPIASLDVDMRKPGGFETITVRKGFSGSYVYLVSNYSRRKAQHAKLPLPPNMDAADPNVRLYVNGDCKPRTFRLPASHNDLEWMVVELTVNNDGFISVSSPRLNFRAPVEKSSPRK